jgi:D-tagatose-1,6-bisphosphate aldolase subunit GatZ/KbaZ
VRERLEEAMRLDPRHWLGYHDRTGPGSRIARVFSFSDRCRYYWPVPAVQEELRLLLANLIEAPPPATLLSQYLPIEFQESYGGAARNPGQMISRHVEAVLRLYSRACTPGPSE